MENTALIDRISQIDESLVLSLPRVKELRARAIELKRAGDVKGRAIVNQQLSVLLSEREVLKTEKLTLLASMRAVSDASEASETV